MKQIIRSNQGMTLIEIMIVLAIIASITAIFGGNILDRLAGTKVKTTRITFGELGKGLDQFNLDCGFYPTTEQGLQALVEAPSGSPQCKNWGPNGYVKKSLMKDAWGNDIVYERKSSTSYSLLSFGADGNEGGEGVDADISSDDE